EISIQAGLELIKQNLQFGIIELAGRRNVGRINDDRATFFNDVDTVVHQLVHGIVKAEPFAMNANASAFQPIRVKELRVVSQWFANAPFGDLIARIVASKRTEQDRGVSH